MYLKAYCIVKLDSNQEGIVMTGEVKDENAVAQFRSPVEAYADIMKNPREDKKRLAGSSGWDEEVPSHRNSTIVAVEQWLCLLLGVVCMACGGWGTCMKYSLDRSSRYILWLGSAYGPTLRFTAVVCLVSGAVLVHRGLASTEMSSASGSRKVLRSASGNSVRNGKREHPFDRRV